MMSTKRPSWERFKYAQRMISLLDHHRMLCGSWFVFTGPWSKYKRGWCFCANVCFATFDVGNSTDLQLWIVHTQCTIFFAPSHQSRTLMHKVHMRYIQHSRHTWEKLNLNTLSLGSSALEDIDWRTPVFWLSSNASLNVFWYVMHVWDVIELMKIHQNQRSKTLIKKKVHLCSLYPGR